MKLAKQTIVWFVVPLFAIVLGAGVAALSARVCPECAAPTGPNGAGADSRAIGLPARRSAIAGALKVHPRNPRYFTDDGTRAVYLAGSHTWVNLQDLGASDPPPRFDFDAYLSFLESHNHNFTRFWIWEQSNWTPAFHGDLRVAPGIYRRSGSGRAGDGKPRFDLRAFNEAFFQRLRDRVKQAGAHGIYVSVTLFNGFSVDDKGKGRGNPWLAHPFHRDNNVNGIDGDFDRNGFGTEVHTLHSPEITGYQEAYVRKVVDTVNDLDNVLFEISNESAAVSRDWQDHMVRFIKSYEATKPRQHPVGRSSAFGQIGNDDLLAGPASWMSPNDGYTGHWSCRLAARVPAWLRWRTASWSPRAIEKCRSYREDPPPATGEKIVIADTDHLWGIGGDRVWVWKSFTRGLNLAFMDLYTTEIASGGGFSLGDANAAQWESVRRNLGYTVTFSNIIDLSAMTPRVDVASSGYCLAHRDGKRYLVYLPAAGSVTVDLAAAVGTFAVRWLDPETGHVLNGGTVAGGAARTLAAPWRHDAVLYLVDRTDEDVLVGAEK